MSGLVRTPICFTLRIKNWWKRRPKKTKKRQDGRPTPGINLHLSQVFQHDLEQPSYHAPVSTLMYMIMTKILTKCLNMILTNYHRTGEWGRAKTSGYNSGPASSTNSKAGSKVDHFAVFGTWFSLHVCLQSQMVATLVLRSEKYLSKKESNKPAFLPETFAQVGFIEGWDLWLSNPADPFNILTH